MYREIRRQSHISAEQKRRGTIKQGFEQLQSLVVNPASYPGGKVSKATILEKSVLEGREGGREGIRERVGGSEGGREGIRERIRERVEEREGGREGGKVGGRVKCEDGRDKSGEEGGWREVPSSLSLSLPSGGAHPARPPGEGEQGAADGGPEDGAGGAEHCHCPLPGEPPSLRGPCH